MSERERIGPGRIEPDPETPANVDPDADPLPEDAVEEVVRWEDMPEVDPEESTGIDV